MWQRFTERARRSILLAQEAAMEQKTADVDSGHLLLGLVRNVGSGASQVLESAGVSTTTIEQALIEALPRGSDSEAAAQPRLTASTKRILELSADEARRLRHNYIGTEHLLLGVLREDRTPGAAQQILHRCGLDLETARAQVQQLTSQTPVLDGAEVKSGWIDAIIHSVARKQTPNPNEVEAHTLLALLSNPDGFAARTLVECGLDLEAARRKLKEVS